MPKSAFIFFSTTTIKRLRAENPELKVSEAAKMTGSLWQQIGEKEKATFNRLHEEDVQR